MVEPSLTSQIPSTESEPTSDLEASPRISRPLAVVSAVLIVSTFLLFVGPGLLPAPPTEAPAVAVAATDEVRILMGAPSTLDPAAQGDSGSAAVSAQLFESLTAFDPELNLRPALAERWEVLDEGQRVVFTLRPGLTFSDGTSMTAADVVRSWLRVIDPETPSPLASLLGSVSGAQEYLRGQSGDPASVGLRALDDRTVEVRLDRAGGDFPAIAASPTLAVVPPGIDDDPAVLDPASFVASGAYRLVDFTDTELTLEANDRYWAGEPAIRTVRLITDIGGRSPVEAFESGDVDYAPISDFDASWIAYDEVLGPQLRSVPTFTLTYYGFDTTKPPFNDPRVRRAFAMAVDWHRIVDLGSTGSSVSATGMVPAGIPGRVDGDFSQRHDPAAARAELAAAGYPNGAGFPAVTLVTPGPGYDEAILTELRSVLGVDVRYESMPFDEYFQRLETDPPAFWSLSWIADYPGPNDFLGILLGSGETNNYGRWSSADFDGAVEEALSAGNPADASVGFARAEEIVRRDAPVIPVSYEGGWSLSRDGLLGAGQNGLGFLRMAGLAWDRQ
jgi:oligopeptide transport system substrate-binding protein